MSNAIDGRAEMERLAAEVAAADGVVDAWVGTSFDDDVLFVEVPPGESVPPGVEERLAAAGLEGTNEAYGIDAAGGFAGPVGDHDEYRYLDPERSSWLRGD